MVNMGGVSPLRSLSTAEVIWYTSGSVSSSEAHLFAESAGGLVVRGESGLELARRLRTGGWSGPLWVDPAVYERPATVPDLTLFGDRWATAQAELQVAEPISPGSYVDAGKRSDFLAAIGRQAEWAAEVDRARISLCLHHRWLTTDADFVAAELEALGLPVALALADRNDPLGYVGAVQGLLRIVGAVPDLMLLRTDLAALGVVANGAHHGAVGTSGTVRHFVPPGLSAGGARNDRSPSVFLPLLLAFKLGSWLEELPLKAVPTCDLACCGGARLSRFNDEETRAEARFHNRLAMQTVVDAALEAEGADRAARFKSMCQDALFRTQELEVAARRKIRPSAQLAAWAEVS